jgi:hypothetical protein
MRLKHRSSLIIIVLLAAVVAAALISIVLLGRASPARMTTAPQNRERPAFVRVIPRQFSVLKNIFYNPLA